MAQLCDMKCVPCRVGAAPLAGQELAELQAQLHHWEVVGAHHLTRTFKFADFAEALDFVNRVGDLSDRQGHHPDVYLTWGKVRLEIRTHKIDGLTTSDFVLAAKIDNIPR